MYGIAKRARSLVWNSAFGSEACRVIEGCVPRIQGYCFVDHKFMEVIVLCIVNGKTSRIQASASEYRPRKEGGPNDRAGCFLSLALGLDYVGGWPWLWPLAAAVVLLRGRSGGGRHGVASHGLDRFGNRKA
jgi:hypothetical protein